MNFRWAIVVAAFVFAATVGVFAYNAGVAHGVQESAKIITLPSGAVQMPMYYWHRPWGFGGFFLFPFFFFMFALFAFRGRRWHHNGGCHYEHNEREENPGRG